MQHYPVPAAAAAEDTHPFIALQHGSPIATGSLSVHADVALLSGASAVSGARGQGAQGALMATRLACAGAQGRTIRMMGASPGRGSQRHAERSGVHIAYTRSTWHRAR